MLSKIHLTLTPGEALLVGVSGGADSVALLDALVQLGYRPHVAHLNHQWRGAESDTDAEFVRSLAGQYGLPVTIGLMSEFVGATSRSRLSPAGRDREVAPTTEAAARQARLQFFESIGISTVALAHTADDQAETFLMRLIRGAGIDGLAGMLPEKQMGSLRIVRPLLAVRRSEVIEYLKSRQLTWREDASNANRQFLRNRIRHELLPLLERDYNPGIRDALWRTAEIVRAEVERDPVAAERRAIRQMSYQQVEELRRLTLKTAAPPPVSKVLEETFDADALGEGLTVRTWRAGDRFQPLGMKGEKKLQDFFVDEKVPRDERTRVPLVCAADGRIAWVVGYRIAEPFKVRPETKRVLRMRFEGC